MRVQKEIQETCCFTGHRILGRSEREIEKATFDQIERAVLKGYNHFICGGALGFDMIAAEQVVTYRTIVGKPIGKPITLEIAIPCSDHTKMWNNKQKARLQAILDCADVTFTLSKSEYTQSCMQIRNQYMVSKSALVIAYYNGKPSGTKKTLEYAERTGREIWYIEGSTATIDGKSQK